jgi:hypothetical protein
MFILRLLSLVLTGAWLGCPTAGAATVTCDRRLSLDARWTALRARDPAEPGYHATLTWLINDALRPGLSAWSEWIQHLDPVERAFEFGLKPKERPREIDEPAIVARRRRLGYDRSYHREFSFGSEFPAPFTKYNRRVMRNLARAVRGLARLTEMHLAEDLARPATAILENASFAGGLMSTQVYVGGEATLFAVAQLTAERVGSLSAEDLLRRVMRAEGSGPSLVAQLALALPAAVLGPYGRSAYVSDTVELSPAGPRFSPALRTFLKTCHAEDRVVPTVAYRLGHGCPIAHRSPLGPSGLQIYLDTVMWAYDSVATADE